MICYKCGQEVGNAKRCPNCGADLSVFLKVRHISNAYYNLGLEQAGVRNLSGAIVSLKNSLKFNKYNIDARNLLGLIYCETGEVVDALSEWVISRSYQPKDNLASHYLDEIQQDRGRLDSVNQTIKKYNQALHYCKQDSRDLAIIQLKKVLSLNPKLVKAHQLLALLYLQDNKLELAKKTLRNAGKIDTNNTTTLRYLREVNARLKEKSPSKKPEENEPETKEAEYEETAEKEETKESSAKKESAKDSVTDNISTSPMFQMYLEELKDIPEYTKEQQIDMYKKLLAGEESMVHALSNAWLRNVLEIAKKLAVSPEGFEDIVQEGNMALFLRLSELCGSHEKVDVEEELLTAVEEAMKSCIRELTGEDENENSVVGKVALVSEAVNYLKKQNGAQPTQKELADYVKIPEDELADILYMIDKAKKDS